MGQQQSSSTSSGDGTANSSTTTIRKSYYEVLGIEKRGASEEDIRKAYRRKALELHPDRNYGNVDEATRLFADVQTAYEVLSDPQERAWYDSHEEAVLLSGQDGTTAAGYGTGSVPVTTSDDIAKLYANFEGRSDFSDSPSGFFASLRETFERLAREEELAAADEGDEYYNNNVVDYPSFGSSEDEYHEVVKPFYDAWSAFATRKSFAWKDVYRLSEAPDRRVRRAMEKENRRLRDEAIKDFNFTIRTLVVFVKKRDPRYKKHNAENAMTDAERQQALRDQAASQAAKARAANLARLEDDKASAVPDWVASNARNGGGEAKEDDDNNNNNNEASEDIWDEAQAEPVQHFECVVCDKLFKNEKQYDAHERSKKHIQATKKIKRQMRKEGIDFGLDDEITTNSTTVADADTTLMPEIDDNELAEDHEDEEEIEDASRDTEDNQRGGDTQSKGEAVEEEEDESKARPLASGGKEEDDDDDDDSSSTSDPLDEDYAPRDVISERLAGIGDVHLDDKEAGVGDGHINSDDDDEDNENGNEGPAKTSSKSKIGKAKAKRAKKAAAAAAAKDTTGNNSELDTTCNACNQSFASKTQLFSHLRQNPSHAQAVGNQKKSTGKKKRK